MQPNVIEGLWRIPFFIGMFILYDTFIYVYTNNCYTKMLISFIRRLRGRSAEPAGNQEEREKTEINTEEFKDRTDESADCNNGGEGKIKNDSDDIVLYILRIKVIRNKTNECHKENPDENKQHRDS